MWTDGQKDRVIPIYLQIFVCGGGGGVYLSPGSHKLTLESSKQDRYSPLGQIETFAILQGGFISLHNLRTLWLLIGIT